MKIKLKYLNLYSTLSLFTILIFQHTSFAVINELYQLQKSLQKLTEFFSKSQTVTVKPKITTYEELRTVMEKAYENDSEQTKFTAKNPDLLNDYEQTIAITTARYLSQEFIKEGQKRENRPAYIPLIAYIVQQVTEQYPDKDAPLYCLSHAAGNLENEFMLIRALRFVGYNKISLVAIDIIYDAFSVKPTQEMFKLWCDARSIPVRLWPYFPVKIENGVAIELFQDAYEYIKQSSAKNHLFLMIQPTATATGGLSKSDLLVYIERNIVTPNYLKFWAPNLEIKIYLPYSHSDFFVISHNTEKDQTIIKNMQETIQKWPAKPLYQKELMTHLITTYFDAIATTGSLGSNPYLSFYDLIKHTALKPTQPLAFKSEALEMTQIKDMSGSLEQIYNRYRR